tara:strand:+ start:2349 stop:4043 length:1695 start_codon:yes stop_codon:yes gene_type:complete
MYIWNEISFDRSLVNKLALEFKATTAIAKVLANRGITSLKSSLPFFNPNLNNLHDPFLMKNMDLVTNILIKSIESNKRIFIFGDYDVDGTTACSALSMFLNELGCETKVYIPDRKKEGYGLSINGIDVAIDWNADILITCDCGINAIEQAEYAKKKNIELIITDHHSPDDQLPKIDLILNPNQKDCKYPFKGLCGGAVAFKLMQAIIKKLGKDIKIANKYLDLISLGTAADIVPLIDENRVIMKIGLEMIKSSKISGLIKLLEISGLFEKEISVGRIAYNIAPRINAAGRLGDANRVVDLFTTKSEVEAVELSKVLNEENKIRQNIQEKMLKEAMKKISNDKKFKNEKVLILWDKNWDEGLIGIIASKLKEEFNKPAIVLSIKDEIAKGSARSIVGFNLFEKLKECQDTLISFGGHPMAAGLKLNTKNLNNFKRNFEKIANNSLKNSSMNKILDIDSEINFEEIDNRFIDFLEKIGPHGPGNSTPKFITRNVQILDQPMLVGNKKHLKMKLIKNNIFFNSIGFNFGYKYEEVLKKNQLDIAYIIEKNLWNGNSTIQLNLKDIKI